MLFPVKITADRPPSIFEIRNMIPQLVRDRLHVMRFADHAVSSGCHLLHQAIHALHDLDHFRQLVGLLEQIVHAVFLELHILNMPAFCMLSIYGIDVCAIGAPVGRVMACTLVMPGTAKTALASLSNTSKSAALRKS